MERSVLDKFIICASWTFGEKVVVAYCHLLMAVGADVDALSWGLSCFHCVKHIHLVLLLWDIGGKICKNTISNIWKLDIFRHFGIISPIKGVTMDRVQKAKDLFSSGYTCSQAVVLAYDDVLAVDRAVLAQVSAPYGGGMGRLREVCGAVSGAVMVISLLTGLDTLVPEEKKELYALERQVAERFKERAGSYICRDLIAVHPHGDTHNSHKPACRELVGLAVEIIEEIKITEYRK